MYESVSRWPLMSFPYRISELDQFTSVIKKKMLSQACLLAILVGACSQLRFKLTKCLTRTGINNVEEKYADKRRNADLE